MNVCTIPTFLLPFASLSLGLLAGLGAQRRWAELGQLIWAAGVIGMVSGLLYLPVGLVSGFARLVGNEYVAPPGAALPWTGYLNYLRELASLLTGVGRAGWLVGGLLLVLPHLLARWLPAPTKALAGLAWLLLLLPLVLMPMQRVYVPARVLLYQGCFGSMLGSLAAAAVLGRQRPAWLARRARLALIALLTVAAYGAYQVRRQWAERQSPNRTERQMEAAYTWLTRQPGQRVLLQAALYELFFYHYALVGRQPLQLHSRESPGLRYDFVIQDRGRQSSPLPPWVRPPAYPVVYTNQAVIIYGRNRLISPAP